MPNESIKKVASIADEEAKAIIRSKVLHSSNRMEAPREPQISAASSGRAAIFHLLAESVRDYAIFAQDANGSILSWNQGVKAILGYDEDEFVGKHVSIIFAPEDIEHGEVDDQMREAEITGQALDQKWHVRRDGSRFWADGLLIPLADGDGNLRGYARALRDETRQKQSEDERDEILGRERAARRRAELLRESLERAQREKDEFLALLAHELRNPLSAILGWLVILRQGKCDDQLLAKGLDTIERSARTQDRIIEDVFDLSRINSGNLKINAEPMLLNEAVAQAVDSIRPAAQAKRISLETEVNTESIFILGDHDRIKQAVINILSNAVKFTPKGGSVLVILSPSDPIARIIIQDNGQGFSAEFGPRIFERYAQANKDSTDGRSGLGLGLSLVREIVEQHGGKVTAESEGEGRGATFSVYLPVIDTKS